MEAKKQENFWKCLKKETCPMAVKRNNSNTCLCSSDMCAKFKCSADMENTHLTETCKIEMVHRNHSYCNSLTEINNFPYENVKKYTCTHCGRKIFTIKEILLEAIEFSYNETHAILDLKERNNAKSSESQQAFIDILQNCSDFTETPLFVTRRKSSVYLCVIGNSKRICIISQCKEKEMQNNKTNSKGPQEIQYSFRKVMEHFKEIIVLVFFGILLFGGFIGFLTGVNISKHRKMKLYHERERQYPSYPRHTCYSELYAEISESPNSEPKEEEDNLPVEEELDNMKTACSCTNSGSDCPLSNCISMDGAYSSIYNALQPNYGQRRCSYPVDDMDTKREYTSYHSLEKINNPYKIPESFQELSSDSQ